MIIEKERDIRHLKDIEIIHYKCFRNLRVNNLNSINLISGKNNVGKTSFMEACYISARTKNIETLALSIISCKFMRENINLLWTGNTEYSEEFMDKAKELEIISNLNNLKYNVKIEDGIKEYIFKINNKENIINAKDFNYLSTDNSHVNFIDNFGWCNGEILEAYQSIQISDKEKELDDLINKFDTRISNFKIISDVPMCKINDDYIEITELGDGIKHYISIICALYNSKNGILLIDEIDNGIHYTHLNDLWELIFNLSKELNCQVFVTTHSKECIESFNNINTTKNLGSIVELAINKKNNNITPIIREADQLNYAIINNEKVRGE